MNQPLRAEVKNGRLVLDQPTDLPEGTVIELVADPFAALSKEERADLNASIDRGLAQSKTNAARPIDDFLETL